MTGWKRVLWSRVAPGGVVLAALVWRLGAGPFQAGLQAVNGWALVAVALLTALATVGAACRWVLLARAFGVALPFPWAFAAYYRSQFLNSVLPGGVAGDVHRAWRHGTDVDDIGLAARAVAWERVIGQLVQVAATAVALSVLPSPFRSGARVTAGTLIGLALVTWVGLRFVQVDVSSGRLGRFAFAGRRDVIRALRASASWPAMTGTSLLVMAGHLAAFLVAARAAGVHASLSTLLALGLLAMLAMSVPLNVAGWGPREGVMAWGFGVAGLGVAHGVTVATTYGILALAATLPGAVVLVLGWLHVSMPTEQPGPAAAREAGPAAHAPSRRRQMAA